MSDLHIVLVNPEIPPNTGNAGRLCLAIDATLHIVHPIPFSMDEKQVRRAGLDYWKHVRLVEHPNADAFWAWAEGRRTFLFSTHGAAPYTRIQFAPGDVLVFGRETVGLPKEWVAERGGWLIPMPGAVRSLNLSNAISIVAYEALRQLRPELF